MISRADLAAAGISLTQQQYDNLLNISSLRETGTRYQVTLEQYAPSLTEQANKPFSGGVGNIVDATVTPDGDIEAVLMTATGYTRSKIIHGQTTWIDQGSVTRSIRHLSIAPGSNLVHTVAADGLSWYDAFAFASRTCPALSSIRYVAAINLGSVHLVGLTSRNNWRLVYWDSTQYINSNIYWPFNISSFDAIEMADGRHLIVMTTDLPPVVDVSVSGTKTTTTYDRVQGVVAFIYDNTKHVWSDHIIIDQYDLDSVPALKSARLTSKSGVIYLSYMKKTDSYQEDVASVIVVSRSIDGEHWELPFPIDSIEVPPILDIGGVPILCTDQYSYALYRYKSLRTPAVRSLNETVASSLVTDVSDYVTSINGGLSDGLPSCSITIENPGGVFDSILTADKALLATVKMDCSPNGIIPIFSGAVINVEADSQLPVNVIKANVRPTMYFLERIGSPESNEFQGPSYLGDNFAPTVQGDSAATSGLGHVAIRAGTWTGGISITGDARPNRGLNMRSSSAEGFVLSTAYSHGLCGFTSTEISFYKELNVCNMPTGAAGESLGGGEYAGVAFHGTDQHNCWYVKFVPSAGNSSFQLVKRQPVIVNGEQNHVDIAVDSAVSLAPLSGYSTFYSGRLYVSWRYNQVKVYRHAPGAASVETVMTRELIGYGDKEVSEYTELVTVEGGYKSHPLTGGSPGYLAYSPKDGYTDFFGDGSFEGTCTPDGGGNLIFTNCIAIMYNGAYLDKSSEMAKVGTYSLKILSPGDDTQGKRGTRVRSNSSLGYAAGTTIRATGSLFVSALDGNATMRLGLNIKYSGDDEKARHGTMIEITDTGKWVPFSFEFTAEQTIDSCEIMSHIEGSGRTTASIWYLDDIKMKRSTNILSYVYFGNLDVCDSRRAYTASDGLNYLHAMVGSLKVNHRYAVDASTLWMNTGLTFSDDTLSGTGYAWPIKVIQLPSATDFIPNSNTGRIRLRSGDMDDLYLEWTATDVILAAEFYGGTMSYRRIPRSIVGRNVRVFVTTSTGDGKTFNRADSSSPGLYVTVLVYADGEFIISGSLPVSSQGYLGINIGFVSTSGAISVSRIRVQELHRIIDFFSVDPGEAVRSGMSRLIGQSRVMQRQRFDGSISIGRLSTENPVWTVPSDAVRFSYKQTLSYEHPGILRFTGASNETTVYNMPILAKLGRPLFGKKDDPNVMSLLDAIAELDNLYFDISGMHSTMTASGIYNPLLESFDLVILDGKNYLVSSAGFTAAANGDGAALTTSDLQLEERSES